MDRFTWMVILIVILLIAGAVVLVNVGGARFLGPGEYLDQDSPTAAVHNLFVALLRQDSAKARAYLSARALEQINKQGLPFPDLPGIYLGDRTNVRVRILEVEQVEPDKAEVTVAIDHFSSGGFLGEGEVWTQTETLTVVREDGVWKVDLPSWYEEPPPPPTRTESRRLGTDRVALPAG